jgi:hypothetical protein
MVQSERRVSLGSIYLNTIKLYIESIFFLTVKSDRKGTLDSTYLNTIKFHIQSIIFCLQSEEVTLAVCTPIQ